MSSSVSGETKSQISSINTTDVTMFKINRKKYFKGTIAVTVIYGTIALFLFLVAILSQRGREIITTDLLPFTITFVIGILIVVVTMIIFVTTAKPATVPTSIYDNYKCPDYWTLSPTEKEAITGMDPQLVFTYRYKCTPPSTDRNINRPANLSFDPADTRSFNISPPLLDTINTIEGPMRDPKTKQIRCDVNYPSYLYLKDTEYKKGEVDPTLNNRVRCQIAKSCGYTWTAACPKIPAADL